MKKNKQFWSIGVKPLNHRPFAGLAKRLPSPVKEIAGNVERQSKRLYHFWREVTSLERGPMLDRNGIVIIPSFYSAFCRGCK